jgi:hypothetical protein
MLDPHQDITTQTTHRHQQHHNTHTTYEEETQHHHRITNEFNLYYMEIIIYVYVLIFKNRNLILYIHVKIINYTNL